MASTTCAFRSFNRLRATICSTRWFHASPMNAAGHVRTRTIPVDRTPSTTLLRSKRSQIKGQPSPPSHDRFDNETLRKIWYATHLYNKGQTALYRAPSHLGLYAASYTEAACLISITAAMGWLGHWAYEPDSGLPDFVAMAYRLTMIVCTGAGGYFFFRSWHILKSIDLVSQDGIIKLLVQVRRPIAFMRPREHLIHPYDFRIPERYSRDFDGSYWIKPSQKSTNILSSIPNSMFTSIRRLMSHDGFIYVNLVEDKGQREVKLDLTSLSPKEAKNLREMVFIEM